MMTKPQIDHLFLVRDAHLHVRVPSEWKKLATQAWRQAQKAPGGERFRTFTDWVIGNLPT